MAKSVTNNDIYEAIGGLRADVRNLVKRQDDQDKLVTNLQSKAMWLTGAAWSIGIMIGLFLKFVR